MSQVAVEEDPRKERQSLLQTLEYPFQRDRCEAALARISRIEWPDAGLDRLLRGLLGQANSMPQPSARQDPLFVGLLAAAEGFLLRLLSRSDLSEIERANAIEAAEVYVHLAGDARTDASELVTRLMAQAEFLRDHRPDRHEQLLTVALRTIAKRAPYDVAPDMADFLRPRDSAVIQQAALAAIIAFYSGPPPERSYPRIWGRLHELLEAYLREELVHVSTQIRDLAISAFIAAAASGMPKLLEDTYMIGCLPPLARQDLIRGLREIRDGWQECRPAADAAMANLDRLLRDLG